MTRTTYQVAQATPYRRTTLAQYSAWRLYPPVGMAGPDDEQQKEDDIAPYPAPVIDRVCPDAFWKCNSDCWNKYPLKPNRINKCVTEICMPMCPRVDEPGGGSGPGPAGGPASSTASWMSPKVLAVGAIGLAVVLAMLGRGTDDQRRERNR